MTGAVNTVRVGPLSKDDAGEVLTVQRAAYVTEAQRYAAPGIPPLRETLEQVRADIVRPGVIALGAWLGPRLVGSVRGRIGGPATAAPAAGGSRYSARGTSAQGSPGAGSTGAGSPGAGSPGAGSLGAGALEVARFAVAPDVQGRGVGRALLAALHAAAPPSVRTMWLVTGARSDDNRRLYAAAGYVVVGSVVDDAGVELVRMERPAGTPDMAVVRGARGAPIGPAATPE